MGSSLGGLMALYTALEYPKVFGKAGVFSPSLWWSDEAFTQIEKFRKRQFQKIYLYGGEKESESLIPNIDRAEKMLQEVGFSENEILKSIAPDGRHNEYYWGREVDVWDKLRTNSKWELPLPFFGHMLQAMKYTDRDNCYKYRLNILNSTA
jgi:alpha-glucosidase